jgi:type II secretory pathway pseudopilin PulG
MELAIILVVVSALASAALGVWLGMKFYALRLLALEKQTELAFTCMEDKVNELQRVATRNQTRDAVNSRWKKKDETDESTLKELAKVKPNGGEVISMPMFNPVDWANGK